MNISYDKKKRMYVLGIKPYTKEEFLSKVELIRSYFPNAALTTDVIVGFPGESQEEFLETYEFIKKVNFAELHVFPFSAREGTKAFDMPDQVKPEIKAERVDKLIKLSEELNRNYISRFKGQELEVILEERNKKTNLLSGFTSNYIKLEADLPDEYIGKIHKIKVR